MKQSRPSLKDEIGEKVPTFYLQKIFSHLPVVPTPCLDSAASNFACIAARCSPIRAARSPTSCACARGCCTACPLGFGSSPRSISACSESCVSFSVRTKCSDCSLTASRQPGSAELEASNSSASAADERAVGTAAICLSLTWQVFFACFAARQPRDREVRALTRTKNGVSSQVTLPGARVYTTPTCGANDHQRHCTFAHAHTPCVHKRQALRYAAQISTHRRERRAPLALTGL